MTISRKGAWLLVTLLCAAFWLATAWLLDEIYPLL